MPILARSHHPSSQPHGTWLSSFVRHLAVSTRPSTAQLKPCLAAAPLHRAKGFNLLVSFTDDSPRVLCAERSGPQPAGRWLALDVTHFQADWLTVALSPCWELILYKEGCERRPQDAHPSELSTRPWQPASSPVPSPSW